MREVALIGLGMVSDTYAAAIANARGLTLGPILATRPESATAFLARHPSLPARPVESVAAIAEDPGVAFAIIATPPNARMALVEALAAAGMPILMEKPVARSLAEAEALVARAEAAGLPLGIVLQHRARPVVADLQRTLPGLGPLRLVEVTVPWWRPQSYYDAPGRGTYARDGGGVLISQAIHTLDLMLSLAGPIAAVTAMAATTGFHRMEAEDFVTAGLRFASGAVGHLMATTASFPGAGEVIRLHGAAGTATLAAGTLRIDRQDGSGETIGQAAASGAGADPMAFTSDWHQSVIEDFDAALRSGRPPLVTGRDALGVHRLIDALERSASAGHPIELDHDP